MCAQHRTRQRSLRRWTQSVVLAVLLGLVALGVAEVASGRYQVRPVLSGSMRPGLPVGGVVITKRVPIDSLHVRDVVVFHRPDQPQDLVVHRIISMTPSSSGPVIETQGDANDAPDPWTLTLNGNTAYRATFSVPLVGYVALWVHSRNGRLIFFSVGFLLVAGAAASGLFARRKQAALTAEPEEDCGEITATLTTTG